MKFESLPNEILIECFQYLNAPEIKREIISLKLSNKGTCNQIQSFLSLDEFLSLRSLSLIDLENNNIKQLLSMLPYLSNLYYFSFTSKNFQIIERLLKCLPNLKILTISI
jgi:hypothetical protein